MTTRFEEVFKKLSPEQLSTLFAHAEEMANQPRPRGKKLRLDWAGCIDSQHTSGLEAQRDAMATWKRAVERSLSE